ncbi:streptavidin-V2-like [Saccostrea cucullata]|uniref:streptavidin-V2-like n=1 Tax=Saccostrea cuccullata TaxID=36930 RepID=UPI002ED0FDAD
MQFAGSFLPIFICVVVPLIKYAESVNCQTQQLKGLCALSGTWRNQLQSVMTITCKGGTIKGQYNSAVGNAERKYDLAGRYLQVNETDFIVGWSVAFKNQYRNAMSIASWTGVYYAAEGTIRTQWILASYKDQEDYWRTYSTNQDTFTKIQSHPCLQSNVN